MTLSFADFSILLISCSLTILVFRTVPLMVLRGRELPAGLSRALGFIPPAAFAALVANDLLSPDMFDSGLWPAVVPLIAALCVVPVAVKSRSLVWSIIVGVGVYAFLLFLLPF